MGMHIYADSDLATKLLTQQFNKQEMNWVSIIVIVPPQPPNIYN